MILGLTGGIGCGKSTVLGFFSQLNWETVDADDICHQLYETRDPELYSAIISRWEKDLIIDKKGGICRKSIANIVFNDRAELKWLNSIIHPLVFSKANKQLIGSGNKYIIFDVPLLFESDWEQHFDSIITVWSPKHLQYQRLLNKGWSIENIEKRSKFQFDIEEKLCKADYGLINHGTLKMLFRQCQLLDKQIKKN